MFGRRLSAFALLLSCVSAPVNATPMLGAECWDAQELEALKVQRFQTMLLVAALNCRERQPWIMADYNAFVQANRALIASKLSLVRTHFIRNLGPSDGVTAYSNYETTIANQFSDASYDRGRCAAFADEMRLASDVSEMGLMDLVHSVPGEDRLAVCPPRPRPASRMRDWAPTLPMREDAPAPTPLPPVAQAPEWPDLAPLEPEGPARAIEPNDVTVAVAPPPPAPMPEKAAEPAPVQMAQVAPAVDRMAAVRDAARVLKEALAALEAAEAR